VKQKEMDDRKGEAVGNMRLGRRETDQDGGHVGDGVSNIMTSLGRTTGGEKWNKDGARRHRALPSNWKLTMGGMPRT